MVGTWRRTPFKYKHGRALSPTERKKAQRAKETLNNYSSAHPKYKKAFQSLESLYSEGVNPHQYRDLRTKSGSLLLIHGRGYRDTIEGRTHTAQEDEWNRKEKHKRLGTGRPSLRGEPMTSAERVFRHRLRKKIEQELVEKKEEEEDEED